MVFRSALVSILFACLAALAPLSLSAQSANPSTSAVASQDATNTTAHATDAPSSGEKADLASGTAHLRVYRARRVVGSALAPSILVDGKQIVRVGNGRRCTIKLSPGTHSIGSDDKSSSISLDAKSGQEYFVRVDEEPGMWKGHGKLTLIAGEQGSPEYKLQKPVEEDRKVEKEMIEDDTDTKH